MKLNFFKYYSFCAMESRKQTSVTLSLNKHNLKQSEYNLSVMRQNSAILLKFRNQNFHEINSGFHSRSFI